MSCSCESDSQGVFVGNRWDKALKGEQSIDVYSRLRLREMHLCMATINTSELLMPLGRPFSYLIARLMARSGAWVGPFRDSDVMDGSDIEASFVLVLDSSMEKP